MKKISKQSPKLKKIPKPTKLYRPEEKKTDWGGKKTGGGPVSREGIP